MDAGSIVIISESILLDESPPDLYSIIITSTGRLVWSPDVVINLRVNYIWVEGRLDIGSEDCPYEGETTITLTGKFPFCTILDSFNSTKLVVITELGKRQKSALNAENTTDLPKTLQVPSLCCFS